MPPANPPRPGLPDAGSVVAETTLRPPRAAARGRRAPAAGATYRIIRTNEVDAKDTAMARSAVAPFGAVAARAAPPSDKFKGKARKSTKLSIASAPIEPFEDLRDLIKTLPSKKAMKDHVPKITTEPGSRRVAEEKRNVRVQTFLYAASREDDNDFHLIIGRDPSDPPLVCMTIEISGLPRKNRKSFEQLKAAREAFTGFFGSDQPGSSYDFYDPPIPVEVEGSLFFDMSHVSGRRPGPNSLRKNIPTIWEIHPISSIVFEP